MFPYNVEVLITISQVSC